MSSSSHPWASAAGAEMLTRGGNAVDAAIATAFTLTVCEPAMSHLGGQGNMLVHLAETGLTTALDCYACAPGGAHPGMYRWRDSATQGGYRFWTEGDLNTTGESSICIPGNVCGWLTAHQRWGSLPLGTVVGPAIRACEGVPLTRTMHARVVEDRARLARFPDTARLFLTAGGEARRAGEVLVQPELAETIARIAAEGLDLFYSGDLARDLVRHVQAAGGLLSLDDLARYPERLMWVREPDRVSFKGHEVEGATPSASALLLNLLGILDGIDFGGLDPVSGEQLHLLAEAMKLAFAERGLHIGDHSQVNVPLAGLLNPEYTAQRRRLIDRERAGRPGPGDPWSFQSAGPDPALLSPALAQVGGDGGCTTHHSHVDRWGNFVALTQSLGDAFGSAVMLPGWGFLLNNAMKLFDPRPGPRLNGISPYRRPLTPWPTIVRKDGVAVMALGSPSGTRIPNAITQVLVNVIGHRMGLQESVDLPRIHWSGDEFEAEQDLPDRTQADLARRGHEVQYRHPRSPWFGAVQVVSRDPKTGVCRGAADPRREGAVAAISL